MTYRNLSRRATLSLAAAALFGMLAGVVPSAIASAGTDRLNPNEQLNPGERLVSPDGQFVLVMQTDGNLVEYAPGNRPVWATGTNRANSIARMQGDGNLVVIAPGNLAVWATGTSGNPNADVELQSDGNVVVYASGHVARWASGVQVGAGALGSRIATVAQNQAADPARNAESPLGTDCNFYSAAYRAGSQCANGWFAEDWCADFARWVYGNAGAATNGLTPAAASFYNYGKARGTWRARGTGAAPKPGDAVVYGLNSGGTWASHVGIVVAVSGSSIKVVSGNSNNRVSTTAFFVPGTDISGYTSPTV